MHKQAKQNTRIRMREKRMMLKGSIPMKSSIIKLMSRLNWNEAIFDAVLFIYVYLFLRSAETYQHESYSYWLFILGGWIAVFTILWYFGIMIRNFRAQPHHKIIIPVLFVAWLWIVTSLLLTLVLHIGWLFNKDEVHHEFAFVQLFIFINFGVFILGLTFGISEISCDQWLEKLMERRAFQFFKAYVLTFFIVSSMCILEEVYVWGAVHRTQLTGGELESGYLLKHLLVTGIIPMRIIFALHPPISRLNIIIGGLGLTYFVYEIVILVNELSGW